ncbi:MAG TPA: ECF-type sigma factor, partial [Rubricoccaceae bacterium]
MLDPVVTALLDRARTGDAGAYDRLVGQLYGELRQVARAQRRRLGASETVNTTAVVHEAYAKLNGRADGPGPYADRAHFFRVAARAMRDVIVDYARARRADKRGGEGPAVSLAEAAHVALDPGALDPDEVLSLDAALGVLERLDPEAARVVELRYFAGLTVDEVADALDLSPSTVKRRWTLAQAWFHRRLSEDGAAT